MIQTETRLNVADNSGAKIIACIKVLGSSGRRYARIGDKIIASVKEATATGSVKKKDVIEAVIVRQKKNFLRRDGTYLRFDENSAVIISKDGEMKGTRIFGPIPRELKQLGYRKIISLAPEIV